MYAIFKKAIKDKMTSFWIYTGIGFAMLLIYVLMQPSMASQTKLLEELMNSFPKELMQAFNAQVESISTLEGLLSSKQFGSLWPILAVVFSTTIAVGNFSGEVDRKTFSILLSQPISRAKIFWSKYLAGTVLLFVHTLFTVTITVLLGALFNVPTLSGNYLGFTLEAFLFLLAFYSLATAISAWVSKPGYVHAIIWGTFISMYIIQVITLIVKELVDLKYFTAFYYFDPNRSLIKGELLPLGLILFGIVIVASVFIGYKRFIKRDIAV